MSSGEILEQFNDFFNTASITLQNSYAIHVDVCRVNVWNKVHLDCYYGQDVGRGLIRWADFKRLRYNWNYTNYILLYGCQK